MVSDGIWPLSKDTGVLCLDVQEYVVPVRVVFVACGAVGGFGPASSAP